MTAAAKMEDGRWEDEKMERRAQAQAQAQAQTQTQATCETNEAYRVMVLKGSLS